jgi:hypothetical protein
LIGISGDRQYLAKKAGVLLRLRGYGKTKPYSERPEMLGLSGRRQVTLRRKAGEEGAGFGVGGNLW